MTIRTALLVALVALVPGVAGAKKSSHTPCGGRFLLDPGEAPPFASAASTGIDSFVLDGKKVTIGASCTARAKLHATSSGWKVVARWKTCAGIPRALLRAKVGYDCRDLAGTLGAKRHRPKAFAAHRSRCGDGLVDAGAGEQCDPPGNGCDATCKLQACTAASQSYASTWEAIQGDIFARHGCTNDLCHGAAKEGDLDLRPDVAYANLVQVPSSQVPYLNRVQPGDERRSYLWLKLLAKTDPARLATLAQGTPVAGTPMPSNDTVLDDDEIEALRLWIYATAPQQGTVGGTETLLKACLPAPRPITAIPLNPPPPDQGIQLVMPPWPLEAHSEHEICFATYYDVTNVVPDQFKDGKGNFYWNAQDLRQDPQSHHLILNEFIGSVDQVHDPSFGAWTCDGGEHAGQTCEPTDLSSCGSGICTSAIKQSFACINFGPQNGGLNHYAIGGAQKAQANTEFPAGVWAPIPLKGILFWNSHAFNLTDEDTAMHGWLNFYFAADRQYPVHQVFDATHIFAATGIPPYQDDTICADYTLDDFAATKQAYLFDLSSHTHRHGKHFWVTDPQHGDRIIYDSFVYNDPIDQRFDPPLVFNRGDKLHYCSRFSNGLADDGSPDTALVTRASHVPVDAPSFSHCTAVACVAGKMSPPASCAHDADCDSSPGAGDGVCDACPITGGESTENEMFILIGQYFVK